MTLFESCALSLVFFVLPLRVFWRLDILVEGEAMQARAILEKTQLIKNAKGRPVKAVLPFRAYRELVQLKISHEIYERPETQKAIRNAKRDIASRRTHRFNNLAEAFRWLDE